MAGNDKGHPEPTSPRSVAADALVSIILLSSTLVAEIIKDRLPKGVPLIVTVILTVIELTMAIYFVVVLVHAIGYAFTEVEKVQASVEGTRSWQMSRKYIAALLSILRESLPNAKDFGRALRFGVRLVSVFAVVGFALLIVLNNDLAVGGDSGPGEMTARKVPNDAEAALGTQPPRDSDRGVVPPATNSHDNLGKMLSDTTTNNPKPSPGNALVVGDGRQGGRHSWQELQRQLEEVEREIAALEERRSQLKWALEGRSPDVESDGSYVAPQGEHVRNSPRSRSRMARPHHSKAFRMSPGAQAPQGGPSERYYRFDTPPSPMSGPTYDSAFPPAYDQPESALAEFIYDLIMVIQSYRLPVITVALITAFLTLMTSLITQAKRIAGEES